MVDWYLWSWILCSMMTFVVSPWFRLKRRKRSGISATRGESVKRVLAGNGECRSADGSDAGVIIVGAGVAGSALAHTLGKVLFRFISFPFPSTYFAFLSNQLGTRKKISFHHVLFRFFFPRSLSDIVTYSVGATPAPSLSFPYSFFCFHYYLIFMRFVQ